MSGCYEEGMAKKELYSKRAHKLNDMLYNWSLEQKIEASIKLIEKALENSTKPIISSSFGKDSMVLTHLVHRVDNSVPILYNDTGVDFPETKEFIEKMKKEWNLKVYIAKSKEWTFWKIVDKYGYPERIRGVRKTKHKEPMCCKLLKTDPTKKVLKEYGFDLNFVGISADESTTRQRAYIMFGDYYYSKTWGLYRCTPLIWWRVDDVWEYIRRFNIPVHPAYSKYGIPRLGCVPCTGHIGWEEQLAKVFLGLYKKIQHDMGQMLMEDYYRGDEE